MSLIVISGLYRPHLQGFISSDEDGDDERVVRCGRLHQHTSPDNLSRATDIEDQDPEYVDDAVLSSSVSQEFQASNLFDDDIDHQFEDKDMEDKDEEDEEEEDKDEDDNDNRNGVGRSRLAQEDLPDAEPEAAEGQEPRPETDGDDEDMEEGDASNDGEV